MVTDSDMELIGAEMDYYCSLILATQAIRTNKFAPITKRVGAALVLPLFKWYLKGTRWAYRIGMQERGEI